MHYLQIILDSTNLLLAVLAFIVSAKLVMRTEKGLDRAMKWFFAVASALLIATLLGMNKYGGFFSGEINQRFFDVSRMLALGFFFLGVHALLRVVDEASKK